MLLEETVLGLHCLFLGIGLSSSTGLRLQEGLLKAQCSMPWYPNMSNLSTFSCSVPSPQGRSSKFWDGELMDTRVDFVHLKRHH